MAQTRFGGSVAPALTDEKLASYKSLVESTDPATKVGDYLRIVQRCVARWWELPESDSEERQLHRSGSGQVIPLTDPLKKELFDLIPWEEELTAIQNEFETLPNGVLRDCAFHLLWHVRELNLDREPITLSV